MTPQERQSELQSIKIKLKTLMLYMSDAHYSVYDSVAGQHILVSRLQVQEWIECIDNKREDTYLWDVNMRWANLVWKQLAESK